MFTINDYDIIIKKFEELADYKYNKFHENLVPGTTVVSGIRVSEIRDISKEIIKHDPAGFLTVCRDGSYE